jgi:hypothetical protein
MTSLAPTSIAGRRLAPTLEFLRHAGEMLLAMVVGMAILGGLFGLALAAGGTDFRTVQNDAPVITALVMAFNMALPMGLWMRFRGHSRARSVEMGAAMFAPGLLAVALMELALIGAGLVCTVECAVMIPVMVGLMLYRRGDYIHPHRELAA